MALLNLCMKLETWAKSILLKHYENGNIRKFPNLAQGLPNQGFMQEKVQKGRINPPQELKNNFGLGSYESFEHLEG